ncbi:EutP/PduV family microcompartment system protein, partial [Aminipila sp.]|uniref:EutP/PduV family microcompartment system protein n=1 Tax=Aminipila sp. TaxID=2060095 RepID=UPI00289EFE20
MKSRKQRIILVGKSQAGKTTLTQYMTNQQLSYHKTQTVEVVNGQFIDTPGEYLEQTGFYGALSVPAADVDAIA